MNEIKRPTSVHELSADVDYRASSLARLLNIKKDSQEYGVVRANVLMSTIPDLILDSEMLYDAHQKLEKALENTKKSMIDNANDFRTEINDIGKYLNQITMDLGLRKYVPPTLVLDPSTIQIVAEKASVTVDIVKNMTKTINELEEQNKLLVDILVASTHHTGALEEQRPRWYPIVSKELDARAKSFQTEPLTEPEQLQQKVAALGKGKPKFDQSKI